MARLFDEKVGERIDVLSDRFVAAIYRRLFRRVEILDTEITGSHVDQVVRRWLGAAAEELLNDNERTKSPG